MDVYLLFGEETKPWKTRVHVKNDVFAHDTDTQSIDIERMRLFVALPQLHSTVRYALVLSSLRGENRVVSVNLSFLSLYHMTLLSGAAS